MQSVLGFDPKYTITDGINELIEAIDKRIFDHVDENRKYFGNYEIDYPVSS